MKESPHKGFKEVEEEEEEEEEEEGEEEVEPKEEKGEAKGVSSGRDKGARFVFCFLCSRERVTEKEEVDLGSAT